MIGYTKVPKDVPKVETKYRVIKTKIPVPESIPLLEELYKYEAYSLHWQFPVFWDKAENFSVYDKYGNKWLVFSGGIAVANCGHGRKEVIDAIVKQAQHGLLYNFTFPSEIRLKLLEKIINFTPDYLEKAFLMSSGSEACENVLKLTRKYAHTKYGKEKNIVITFENGFHGRTLGSQMMGGIPDLKDWIVNLDKDIYQVPFPDGFYNTDISFETFLSSIEKQGIDPKKVAAVYVEGVQGATIDKLPLEYAKSLREWCDDNNALLAFDEVQSGFGRTGKKFGFMHYGVEADVISLGKGLSSSMPISATVARKEIMNVFPPGTMTSTHTGNPISCAAAIANIELIENEKLVENSAKMGLVLGEGLQKIADKYEIIKKNQAVGLMSGIHSFNPGTNNPNKEIAYEINQRIIEKGVMMFCPVGKSTIKITPPLTITKDAILEGLSVVDEAIGEIISEKGW